MIHLIRVYKDSLMIMIDKKPGRQVKFMQLYDMISNMCEHVGTMDKKDIAMQLNLIFQIRFNKITFV